MKNFSKILEKDAVSRGEMKWKAVTYGGALRFLSRGARAQDVHRNNPRFIVWKMRQVRDSKSPSQEIKYARVRPLQYPKQYQDDHQRNMDRYKSQSTKAKRTEWMSSIFLFY